MSNQEFKALVIRETEPKKFTRAIEMREIKDLPAGEVLIKVHYSSLNYKDGLSASGNRGVTRNYPHTPGIDAAGVVEASESDKFKVGDAVIVTGYDLGMNTAGGLGQYIRVPAEWVLQQPAGLSAREAMILGTAGLTAALSVDKLWVNGVRPADGEILVTGATGGVGSVAVAILSKLGFKVVASTGKDESEFLTSIGASQCVKRDEVTDDSGKPMLKPRWGGVIDSVAGRTLEAAIKTTKPGGSVTCCGMITDINFSSSIFPFILRGVNLLGVDSVEIRIAKKKEMWEKLGDLWKPKVLELIAQEITLDEVNPAIDAILAGKARGRIVVNMQS